MARRRGGARDYCNRPQPQVLPQASARGTNGIDLGLTGALTSAAGTPSAPIARAAHFAPTAPNKRASD